MFSLIFLQGLALHPATCPSDHVPFYVRCMYNCPHVFIQDFLLPFTLNLFMHSHHFTANKSSPDHQLSFLPLSVSSHAILSDHPGVQSWGFLDPGV